MADVIIQLGDYYETYTAFWSDIFTSFCDSSVFGCDDLDTVNTHYVAYTGNHAWQLKALSNPNNYIYRSNEPTTTTHPILELWQKGQPVYGPASWPFIPYTPAGHLTAVNNLPLFFPWVQSIKADYYQQAGPPMAPFTSGVFSFLDPVTGHTINYQIGNLVYGTQFDGGAGTSNPDVWDIPYKADQVVYVDVHGISWLVPNPTTGATRGQGANLQSWGFNPWNLELFHDLDAITASLNNLTDKLTQKLAKAHTILTHNGQMWVKVMPGEGIVGPAGADIEKALIRLMQVLTVWNNQKLIVFDNKNKSRFVLPDGVSIR